MKSRKLRILAGTLLIATIGAVFTGCGSKDSDNSSNGDEITISVTGSTSVGPLMEKIQEAYEEKSDGVTIEIQQTGSGAGIKDTMNGVNNIGMASRDLKSEETGLKTTVIAHDGIALIVHPNNKVHNITIEQIKGIYTGKITNWKELGGDDKPIVVVTREEGSGTRDAFQELIGYKAEELIKNATTSEGNGNVKTTVAGNENAIGFVSFEYINDGVKALTVDGVEANAENVKGKTYKLSRPFLLITKEGVENADAKALIDFILSDEGQNIVKENKLISIK